VGKFKGFRSSYLQWEGTNSNLTGNVIRVRDFGGVRLHPDWSSLLVVEGASQTGDRGSKKVRQEEGRPRSSQEREKKHWAIPTSSGGISWIVGLGDRETQKGTAVNV